MDFPFSLTCHCRNPFWDYEHTEKRAKYSRYCVEDPDEYEEEEEYGTTTYTIPFLAIKLFIFPISWSLSVCALVIEICAKYICLYIILFVRGDSLLCLFFP